MMEYRPVKEGVILLGVYLSIPGLAVALVLGAFRPGAGLLFFAAWEGLAVLTARFELATLRVRPGKNRLVAQAGRIFPWEIELPLSPHVSVVQVTTPFMKAAGCCWVRVSAPSGGVWLWAVSPKAAQELARLVREE